MSYRHRVRGGPPGPRKQGGATLVLVAGFLLALLTCLALAIEVGRLYASQSSLQRTADIAALDAANRLSGCRTGAPPQDLDAAVSAAIDGAIQRNESVPARIDSRFELGLLQNTSPERTFVASAAEPDSVHVTLTQPVPTGLTGLITGGDRQMQAHATAMSRPVAQIAVGTKLLNVSDASVLNALLSGLLGGSVNLSVGAYNALIGANVTLADMVEATVGVGTPEELLTTNLTLPEALQVLGDAVDSTVAGAGNLAGTTLDTLAGLADPNRSVLPGDAIVVEEGLEGVVGQVPINVADLLTSLAQAANEGTPISLPTSVSLPPLANVDATINIVEPPQVAIGRAGRDIQGDYRTVATSSQVSIQLRATVLGFPGSALLDLPVYIKAGSASARLEELLCANPLAGRPEHEVAVGTGTSVAQIGIGEFDDIGSANPQPTGDDVTLVNLLGGLLKVNVQNMAPINVGSGPGNQTLDFVGPFPPQDGAEAQTQTVGTDLSDALGNALGTLAADVNSNTVYVDSSLPLLGTVIAGLLNGVVSTVGGLVDLVVDLVQPVLNALGDAVLTPLFELLGLDIGAADVSVQAVLVDQPEIYRRDGD